MMYPGWFKTILKSSNNTCRFTDDRATRLVNTGINSKLSWTHWHGINPQDIQACIQNGAVGPYGNASTNASKWYMYNHSVDHIWKNNTNTVAIMEFYKLTPRRDLPVWVGTSAGAASTQVISPPNTYNYADCARPTPNMYTQGWDDQAAGGVGSGTGTKIASDDVEATPYMSPPMASFFRITPLKVNGPSGRSAFQTIAPGTEATLSVKHTKPRLCNYSKYGLTAASYTTQGATIPGSFEVLRETPLIFVYLRGGVGHEKSTSVPPIPGTSVATTNAAIDYMRKSHWQRVIVATGAQQSVRLITPASFTNVAKETNQFNTDDIEEDLT